MKTSIHRAILVASALLLCSGWASAQETMIVSGPLNSYMNLSTGEVGTDYTFTATVHYDSSVPVSENSVVPGDYEEAFYNLSIIDIEYSIYDADSVLVVSGTEDGAGDPDTINFSYALNDLSGANDDLIRYEVLDVSPTHMSRVNVNFLDSTGLLVSDVLTFPQPPMLGDFDLSVVNLQFMDFTTSEGFRARGEVALITVSGGGSEEPDPVDPYQECAEQAMTHGHYVSCVSQVSNMLRAAGEISGKEKGKAVSAAARSNKK